MSLPRILRNMNLLIILLQDRKQEHAAQAPALDSALPRADIKETTTPGAEVTESTEHK